jgi:hypothetical protein
MSVELLNFSNIQIANALENCKGVFCSAATLSAAERSWPFLEKYLNRTQANGVQKFRDLIDASWLAATNDLIAQTLTSKLLSIVEHEIPDESQAKAIGFEGVLESTIVIIRAAEATLEKSVEKSVYALEQSYVLFDALVTSRYQTDTLMIEEHEILSHELVQGELRRIYRDCSQISHLNLASKLPQVLSQFKQRAVEESEEIQTFLANQARKN